MKVLHVTSGNKGGAYKAVLRLAEVQQDNGLEVSLIFANDRALPMKVLSKASTLFNRLITKKDYGIMSFVSINGISIRRILKQDAEIIHIHNFFNMMSIKNIIKLSKVKKVVLTLHDERLITGGCHNHLSCEQIKTSCIRCPALQIPMFKSIEESRMTSNSLLKSSNISVITPSEWLKAEVEELAKRKFSTHVISNAAPSEFSEVQKKVYTRNPHDLVKIGFIAADPWVPLKGLQNLINSLIDLQSKDLNFQLQVAGIVNEQEKLPSFAVPKGYLGESQLVDFLKSIDFIVVSSLSENLPNVIIESQLVGTVVIATNVGGIPELINDGESGYLLKSGESLTSLLERALSSSAETLNQVSENARNEALNKTSPDRIFSLTMKAYQEVP